MPTILYELGSASSSSVLQIKKERHKERNDLPVRAWLTNDTTKDFQSSKESVVEKNVIDSPIPGIPWTFETWRFESKLYNLGGEFN